MAYWINEGNNVVSWIFFLGRGLALLKSSYYYMDMLSLPKVMEKLIYDNYAPGLKGPPGACSNRSSVRLSVRLSAIPSRLQIKCNI